MNSRKIAHYATVSLLILFTAGFVLNGFYKYNFDLGSVWYGVGIFVIGRSTKYAVDSKYNSKPCEKPDGE